MTKKIKTQEEQGQKQGQEQKEVHGIVSTTVSFPNEIPENIARTIAYDVEQMLFETVGVINGHYRKKLGLNYNVLEVGLPALENFLNQEQINSVTFH